MTNCTCIMVEKNISDSDSDSAAYSNDTDIVNE